jgi:hypothetical protein
MELFWETSAVVPLVLAEPHDLFALRQFNRPLGLRAADAGHLFVYSRAHAANPKLEVVTFDHE